MAAQSFARLRLRYRLLALEAMGHSGSRRKMQRCRKRCQAMNRRHWDSALIALVLVRAGQELGTDSRLARAIAEAVAALLSLAP